MRHLAKVVTASILLGLIVMPFPGQADERQAERWMTSWSSVTSSSSKYGLKLSIGRGGPLVSVITPKLIAARESHIADLLSKGEYDGAITALDAAIHDDAENAVSYVNRGFAWAMKGDLDKAIADFDEAIRLDPKADAAYSNRGNAWRVKGELDKALADVDMAIRLQPNHGTYYNNRGSIWLAMGNVDRAIADCNDAMRLDAKKNHVHYYNRGLAWRSKWELDNAIADYTEALRLEPRSARIYVARCDAWRLKGVLDKAIADANEATRLDPGIKIANDPRRNHPEPYDGSPRSLAELDAATGLGLGSAVADLGPGSGGKAKRDVGLVTASAGEARPPDPGQAGEFLARGIARNAKGEFGEFLKAIGDFLVAIRLDPTCVAAYLNRVIAWESIGDYGHALADFDEAIRLDPNNRQALDSNARLCATCPDASHRDGPRAVALATRAGELSDWKEPHVLDTLAAACAEAGDHDAAVKWQERVIEMTRQQPCPDRAALEEQRARLALYQAKKPYQSKSAAK
jgi:tetratricopeptide (TPR) repeat protein